MKFTVNLKMWMNYFQLISLCAAILAEISLAAPTQPAGGGDLDVRNTIYNVMQNTVPNMKRIAYPNIAADEIRIKDEPDGKFFNISLTKIQGSYKKPSSELKLKTECELNQQFQLQLNAPLGNYLLRGFLRIPEHEKTYSFSISLEDMKVVITAVSNNQNASKKIDIEYSEVCIILNDYKNRSVLLDLVSSLSSQIVDQLFANVTKEDYLSYFSTTINQCFQIPFDTVKENYLINRTSIIKPKPDPWGKTSNNYFTVEWIKIENVNFKVTGSQTDTSIDYEFSFVFNNQNEVDITFGGHINDRKDQKNHEEYSMKSKLLRITIGLIRDSPEVIVSTKLNINSYTPYMRSWLKQEAEFEKIITDDLTLFLSKKYKS